MAELLITEIDGIGEAEYDHVNAELGLDINGGGDWPDGLISHTTDTTETGLIVIEIWESREAQQAEMPKLGAAIQKAGLQEKPMRANWSKLNAHVIPDKAISGGMVEAQGVASEYRTVTTLIPRIAAATLLILLAGTFSIANNNVTGSINKPMYIGILVLGIAITALFLRSQRSTAVDTTVAVLSGAGLVWGIWTVERPQYFLLGFWQGFGYHVAVGVLLLVVLFGTVIHFQDFTRPIRSVLGLLVGLCCLFDLLGLIRTIDFMPYVKNNLNEINDVLGPIVGNVPDSKFIPEYSVLYGWLFVPLGHLLSPNALVGLITIFFTLLDIACVLLAIWVTRRALGTRGFILALAFVVPITYVTSRAGGNISSIASLFQELPIRLFSGFVIAALGLNDLVLLYRGTLRIRHVLLVGVVCGVVAWNSQDFGLAAAGVYGLMILLGATHLVRRRALGVWCVGLLIGVASYPLFLLAIGSPMNLSFVGAFVKLFAAGVGAAPIQVPGPVLVIMPIVVCSTAAGWALMRSRHREGARADAVLDRATITLAFVGTWSAVCMVYYVNRAWAAGQLQTMLLPCGVCVGALFSILIHTDEFGVLTKLGSARTPWAGLSSKVAMIPIGVLVTLCFSSAALTPNPIVTVTNLVTPSPMNSYSEFDIPQLLSAVRLAQAYTSDKPGELTYLGESFNYVLFATKVQSSALLFPYYISYKVTSVIQIQCAYLQSHHSQWMVLSLDAINTYGTTACGMYRPIALRGLVLGQLQELT